MIRSYDQLYNGFIESMMNLEEAKNQTVSTADENELLNRISELENEKIKNQQELAKFNRNTIFLESRIQKMDQVQKEYQTINEKIQIEETMNNEQLKYESERLKNEVQDLKRENLKLNQENEKLLEKLEELETTKAKEIKDLNQEKEQISNKLENLELMNKDYELKIAQTKSGLEDKKKEINNLIKTQQEYLKKYNVMQQLNKTNESTLRSVQKDLAKSLEDADNAKKETNRIKDIVRDLIRSWKIKGGNKGDVNEMIDHFGDAVTINENLDDNMTINSYDESHFDLNNELKMLDGEIKSIDFNVSRKSINLDNLSNMGSIFLKNTTQMKSLHGTYNNIPNSPMNFQKRNNASQINFGIDDDQISIEENIKKDQMKKKMEREKFIKEEFKTQLTEQLNNKINSRFKIKLKSQKKDILDDLRIKNPFEESKDEKQTLNIIQFEDFKENIKNKLFSEFDSFEQSVINLLEKEHIKKKWLSLDNVEDSIVWIISYFREKINEIHSKNKKLTSENSK